jgi:hypothetical protein
LHAHFLLRPLLLKNLRDLQHIDNNDLSMQHKLLFHHCSLLLRLAVPRLWEESKASQRKEGTQ